MAKSHQAGRSRPRRGTARGPEGRFRIIGGQWRGRRLPVPPEPGVRPTPDRVRETLFNWLAPVIEGARCLDLYAGSGALGLEALSRGAARVVFVDRTPAVLQHLRESLGVLGSDRGEIMRMDAMSYLGGAATPFDIVFLDPPYRQDLVAPALEKLVGRGWLAPGASVYIEHEAGMEAPVPPAGWSLFRSAAAGQVRYHLARPEPSAADQP
jgi:16S rRNA (guanine966-N2)-methyltransferase